MGQEDLEFDNRINTLSNQLQQLSWSSLLSCSAFSLTSSGCTDVDYGGQLKLIIQVIFLLLNIETQYFNALQLANFNY